MAWNSRVTPKERGLLKGAVRRVFSRSELRRKALDRVTIEHSDERRPRVKKWGYCESCGVVEPKYLLSVDHKDPIVPVDSSFEEMGMDSMVNRAWCVEDNLQCLCDTCHTIKTKAENKQRRENKKKERP